MCGVWCVYACVVHVLGVCLCKVWVYGVCMCVWYGCLSVYEYCMCVVFGYLCMWEYMGEYLHGMCVWCICVACVA